MSFAFTWSSQPELNAPELNSPRPCSHGAGCSYEGPCAFVHPGEEGTGRRLFPARTKEDGSVDKAIVRLIGSPGFYERRRLRLSWADWCAKKGIPYTKKQGAPKPAQKPKAPEVFAPSVIKFTPSSAPIGRPPQQAASGPIQAPPRQAPMAPMAPMGSSFMPPMAPTPEFYAMMRDFCQAQLSQAGRPDAAIQAAMGLCQPQMNMPHPMQGYGPSTAFGLDPRAFDVMAQQRQQIVLMQQQQRQQQQQKLQEKRAAEKAARDALGERLYPLVVAELESFKQTVNPAEWPANITAGRITGMFLELEGEEVEKMISDGAYLSSQMFEAYDVLKNASVAAAIAEAPPKKLTKSFKDVI